MSGQNQTDEILLWMLANEDAGEPAAPEVAAFWPVVQRLLLALHREAAEDRREAVVDWALTQVRAVVQAAAGHTTRRQQRESLANPLLSGLLANYPRDLRTMRRSRLPSDLLSEYEFLLPEIRETWKRVRSPIGRKKYLSASYGLSRRKSEAAAAAGAASAAHIVLGDRHGVSSRHVSDTLTKMRKARKSWESLLEKLAKHTGDLSD